MPRIAFLSTDNLEDFFVYDALLEPVLHQHGYDVDTVSWHRQDIDWSVYEMVVVRSTWDYQQQPDAFMTCLTSINQHTQLQNPLALMRWNLDKSYLNALEKEGVATLPTYWAPTYDEQALLAQFDRFQTEKLVVKPTVSANADDTFVVTRETLPSLTNTLLTCFSHRSHMIQPFAEEIIGEGEYSLFYFGEALSHCILKKPKEGDFRVQEEHGGSLLLVSATQDMQAVSEAVLAALPEPALYARIDIVRFDQTWRIIEVELIEPSLYFNLDQQSPQRFVDALLRLNNKNS